MRRIRVIPVLLLNKGGLYKTIKFKTPNYIGDPINTVKLFNEKEADEIVILDISATLEKREPDYKKIAEIAGEAFMPMAYGGGIRTLEDARKVFDAGFEKVVLNSTLFDDISLINQVGKIYGNQSVVVCVDVKKNFFGNYKVVSHSSKKYTSYHPVDWCKKIENAGAGEIILQSVDRDGTWDGYDLKLVKLISDMVSIPVIACGGAGSVEDFKQVVIESNASAVAAGSIFVYQKKGMGILINIPLSYINL